MDLIARIFFFIVMLPSAIIHEYMHGYVADQLGDPTARYAGRLTLNPLAHIDLWGTILLPLMLFVGSGGNFLFAYAKPVPYNPYNLKNQKWGSVLVAIAGPLSNFVLAIVFGLLTRVIPTGDITLFLSIVVYANVLLGVFNLVPIPPLDGSKILFAVLPDSMHNVRANLERYGFVILLIFIFFFFDILQPFIEFFYTLFTGGGGGRF
ncbi:MAG: site-2 protease family protein [Candidatus Magasanikbacteria bacterium]|jgi:Zn-dependent protease|nr:site-2 protease family protein [Candidatus Magasanikbacteria bacterium]